MVLYVLTTEQDSAPQSFLPANGTSSQTFDTTPASAIGGGGYGFVGRTAFNGALITSSTQTVAIMNVDAPDDTTATFQFNIPVQLAPTAPGDDLFCQFELLLNDSPLSPEYALTAFYAASTGSVQLNLTGTVVVPITGDVNPLVFSLKGHTNGTTTATFGTDGGTFPNAAEMLLFGNPSELAVL